MRERRIAVKRAASRKRLQWSCVVGVVRRRRRRPGRARVGAVRHRGGRGGGRRVHRPGRARRRGRRARGTPVLRADTDAAERELEAIPWVRGRAGHHRFPTAPDRAPRAHVRGHVPGLRRAFRVIDQDGRVLDVLDAQPVDYLLVSAPGAAQHRRRASSRRPASEAAASLIDALTPAMRAPSPSRSSSRPTPATWPAAGRRASRSASAPPDLVASWCACRPLDGSASGQLRRRVDRRGDAPGACTVSTEPRRARMASGSRS